jgi:thioester reductase-like protein
MSDAQVTLVTGFPNFRATHLISYLLSHGSGEVWLVVLERDVPLVERYRDGLPPALASRFRYFSGDPGALDMGLAGAEYRELSDAVTSIQHLAQVTGPTFGKESYEHVNVGGTREVLELGLAAGRLSALVVHSGLVVSGDRQGYVTESELVAGQRFAGPGPATLARAELMARRRMDRLPIVVLRAGQVVGPSDSGVVDNLDGVYLLILLILNAPQDLSAMLPDWGEAPLHVVPVDHFVRAADALSRHPPAFGKTLHLTDPQPMTVRRAFNQCMKIRERLAEEGVSVPPPSVALRKDGVMRDSLQALLWRPRAFINTTFRKVSYGTESAERMLAEVGLVCPRLEAYFERLVRHVAQAVSLSPQREGVQ